MVNEIPRFDILGGSGANFRAVNTVQPTGLQAEAELFNSVARDFDTHATRFAQMQQEANNLQLAERDIDLDLKMQEVSERNSLNPNGFMKDIDNYISATADSMPRGVRDDYLLRAKQKTTAAFIQKRRAFIDHQVSVNRREAAAFLEVQENRLLSYGAPSNDVELGLLQQDKLIYERFIDSQVASGRLTQSEAVLKKTGINEGMQASYLLGKMQQSDTPMDFLLNALDGKVDDPLLKDMSPGAMQKALGQGQQLFSALQQIEQRDDRIRTEMIEAQKTIHVDNIYTNPTTPAARESLKVLKVIAETPEERIKLQKLDQFVEEAEQAKYVESDPETVFGVEADLAKGGLTENKLDELHGKGLSNDDYNKYRQKLERERDSLIAGPSFKLLKERMDAEFPSPEKQNPIAQLLGLSDDVDGAAKLEQMEQNDRLKTQTLIDLKTRILDSKEITTESGLLEAGNAAIVKMRQEVLQGGGRETPTPTPLSTTTALQDTEAVTAAKKYKGQLNQLKTDVKRGKVTPQLARKIYNILGGVDEE